MATGVVVWAPEGATVRNGDVVWIWESSRIRKALKIERPEGGGSFEIDQWRVKSFPGESEAKAFQAAFAPVKDTWATSGKQGLPVREAPDSNSNRLYKLGLNETVKVLVGNGPKVKEGNLAGSWVQILTQDGYTGWVFDFYLSLEVHTVGEVHQIKGSGPGDQMVQAVLAQAWYPDDMQAQVEQDRINLTMFRADAGMRAVASPPAFLLFLPGQGTTADERLQIPIDTPKKLDPSTYSFGGPQKAQVQFVNAEGSKMVLSFTVNGTTRSIPLALIDDNVGTIISRELANRQQKLTEILSRGKTLTSPTYGTIKIADDGTFTWDGHQAALPQVPGNRGKITFDWFKDKRLYDEFRAVRFQFGDDQNGTSQIFLYRFLKDGFQMLPATSTDLDPVKQTVVRQPSSGLSLYFTFQD